MCGKGGGLRPGKGHRVCGETEEPVNLMEIIKGMVVTREAAREEGQIEVGGDYAEPGGQLIQIQAVVL